MPKNLEVKAKITSAALLETVIKAIGAKRIGEMSQIDTYFRATNGRLKLREIGGNLFELIGYDRGESSSKRLSDFTLAPIQSAEPLKSILGAALGLRGIIRKRRTLYRYRSTRIHIDEVELLGHFLEFETAVGEDMNVAQEEINFLISKFQIQEVDFIRMSYIDMLEKGEN